MKMRNFYLFFILLLIIIQIIIDFSIPRTFGYIVIIGSLRVNFALYYFSILIFMALYFPLLDKIGLLGKTKPGETS